MRIAKCATNRRVRKGLRVLCGDIAFFAIFTGSQSALRTAEYAKVSAFFAQTSRSLRSSQDRKVRYEPQSTQRSPRSLRRHRVLCDLHRIAKGATNRRVRKALRVLCADFEFFAIL